MNDLFELIGIGLIVSLISSCILSAFIDWYLNRTSYQCLLQETKDDSIIGPLTKRLERFYPVIEAIMFRYGNHRLESIPGILETILNKQSVNSFNIIFKIKKRHLLEYEKDAELNGLFMSMIESVNLSNKKDLYTFLQKSFYHGTGFKLIFKRETLTLVNIHSNETLVISN